MVYLLCFDSIFEILLAAFSKNVSYLFLCAASFFVLCVSECQTEKSRAIMGVICGGVLAVSFYKIITAHLMFGAYMNDYLLMIIRLSVLSVMFAVFMVFGEKREKTNET